MTPHQQHHHDGDEVEIFDRGLQFDVATLIDRRRALKLIGAAGLFGIVACGTGTGATTTLATPSPTDGASSTTTGASSTTVGAGSETTGSCEVVPEETAGPYPGDGSNGPNVLDDSGIVRSDIRSSFGESSGVADGIPLTIGLTVQDAANGCAALAGAAVYLWHCDREGNYSMYSEAAAGENYLRGVQQTDGSGVASFESIFPACYPGRWPHIHFEVYPDVASATASENKIATSQIALPEGACQLVYATSGYERSIETLSQVSLAGDNVFGDGWEQELGTVSGDVGAGMTVELTIAI